MGLIRNDLGVGTLPENRTVWEFRVILQFQIYFQPKTKNELKKQIKEKQEYITCENPWSKEEDLKEGV